MASLSKLAPDFKAIMEDIIKQTSTATGLTWIPVSTFRSIDEQNKLYAQGRTQAGGIVTNAKGGSSSHNFGLGCDCAPLRKDSTDNIWWTAPSGYWETYAAIVEASGMTAGRNFKSIEDNPHAEHPRWRIEQDKWRKGEVSLG